MILGHLKTGLAWLRDQVLTAIRRGDERAAIHELNLIPPDLLANQPDVYQPYYILREHVIDRLYDQNVGYWGAHLEGLIILAGRIARNFWLIIWASQRRKLSKQRTALPPTANTRWQRI